MKLDKDLFEKVAAQAEQSPRLRMHFDLRDSADEKGQRMMNVLLPGTNVGIHRHLNTSEVTVCIYGSVIEHFYDEQGRETETVVLTAGGDTPGVWIPAGTYHSLEATDSISVIVEAKAGKYDPETTEEFLLNE